jgi:hypothetical protein
LVRVRWDAAENSDGSANGSMYIDTSILRIKQIYINMHD